MRYLLFIILFPLAPLAQQTIELCDEEVTFTYLSLATGGTETQWLVNGEYFYGDEVSVTWDEPGSYLITATRFSGNCLSTPVSYQINVIDCEELVYFVPNTFTPDGDNLNGTWGPTFSNERLIGKYNLCIYNRWGELLFESSNPNDRWNGVFEGNQCQNGIYIYSLLVGYADDPYKEKVHGHVTIIR